MQQVDAASAKPPTMTPASRNTQQHQQQQRKGRREDTPMPSITVSVFACWIVPVVLIAILTRFATETPSAYVPPPAKQISFDFSKQQNKAEQPSKPRRKSPKEEDAEADGAFDVLKNKPASYQEAMKAIYRRRLDWQSADDAPMEGFEERGTANSKTNTQRTQQQDEEDRQRNAASPASSQPEVPRSATQDPSRIKLVEQIDIFREEFQQDRQDMFKATKLADALRIYDVQYHDGGTAQQEAISTYLAAIKLAQFSKQKRLEEGEETNRALTGVIDVNEEISLDMNARSIDGVLCALHTGLGKTYFMANMFEKAIEAYSQALELGLYMDAMSSRGSARIITGDYEGAASDFTTVMENDKHRMFQDVYTGLARVLQAKESAVPQGWGPMVESLSELIAGLEAQVDMAESSGTGRLLASSLNRFYHVMFLYHDVKTKDTAAAWEALTKSYEYKLKNVPPWNKGFEMQKIAATKQIFNRGFWPEGVGSPSKLPVFVIGFVRSGSTLLERVLDAHPQVVGTGENSVFNGRLDDIRNKLVETSMSGDPNVLATVIESLADGVVDEMRERWDMVASSENRAAEKQDPLRFVDKMLTNYYNVGFIHMLFPNALILHVAREPMDTIFSAYKHEFPPGALDYTSEFNGLSEFYHGYRTIMEHWEKELPGRIMHVRYEDMVDDMPGVAKKVIEATGLEWDDSVLEFHKKKQAVNTLSTTQVRKGVYRDSLQAWRKYEEHLQPLVTMIGDRTKYDLTTTVAGYTPPPSDDGAGDARTDL